MISIEIASNLKLKSKSMDESRQIYGLIKEKGKQKWSFSCFVWKWIKKMEWKEHIKWKPTGFSMNRSHSTFFLFLFLFLSIFSTNKQKVHFPLINSTSYERKWWLSDATGSLTKKNEFNSITVSFILLRSFHYFK